MNSHSVCVRLYDTEDFMVSPTHTHLFDIKQEVELWEFFPAAFEAQEFQRKGQTFNLFLMVWDWLLRNTGKTVATAERTVFIVLAMVTASGLKKTWHENGLLSFSWAHFPPPKDNSEITPFLCLIFIFYINMLSPHLSFITKLVVRLVIKLSNPILDRTTYTV